MHNTRLGASVTYALAVITPDGRTASRLPPKRNLILDAGLDLVASQLWANVIGRAVVGTGATPVKRDSGAITFSRAGSVVTASAGFFEAGDVGRLIKFDSGAEMYVTAYTSPTQVTVSQSGALAASEGTVWYVNQTGLAAESKRTNTVSTDSGDNGTTVLAGSVALKRTFIFSAETGSVTYNEIGWSNSATAGNNLFGRDVITGGVSLVSGQQLKVTVTLTVSVTPTTSQAYASVITGWSQAGNWALESMPDMFSEVSTAGATTGGAGFMEPSAVKNATVSTDTAALVALTATALNVTGVVTTITLTPNAYTTGTFSRTFTGTFSITQGNSAAIRSLCFHGYSGQPRRNLRILLNAAETKTSAETLELTVRLTWGRILTN